MRCRFSVVSRSPFSAAMVDWGAVVESVSEACGMSGAPAVSMMAGVSDSKLPPEPCGTESGDGATLGYFVFQNVEYVCSDYLGLVGLNVWLLLGACLLLGLHLERKW